MDDESLDNKADNDNPLDLSDLVDCLDLSDLVDCREYE